jgi:hypothetical protein
MEITTDQANLNIMLQTYRGAVKEITKFVKEKIEFYSNFKTQEDLEKYGWENGEKREWIECIKDFIVFIDNEWIDPELQNLQSQKKVICECYESVLSFLRKYMDMTESNYRIVAIWIIGTWMHDQFESYPYLFINAMRGSGKTRLLKLIKSFSKDGALLNSLTEAVLFRTTGTLCIDEFEGIGRKGGENLRELFNSAYKKGTKVKRISKRKVLGQEEMIVEEFEPYRPISIANIWGMEDVLGDRCIPIILEKSGNKRKTRLMELWEREVSTPLNYLSTLNSLIKCRWCRCRYVFETYTFWNDYIYTNNTNNTNYTNDTNYTTLFNKIKDSEIDGRLLELSMPLLIIANLINEETFDLLLNDIQEIIKNKKEENMIENTDISLIDFLSQELDSKEFFSLKDITRRFKDFIQSNEEWLNEKWMTRALKRLNLIIEHVRRNSGVYVKINYLKAQEKIKQFK